MTQVFNISQPEYISTNKYYSQQASSLIIIDASVDNLEILKAGLKPGAEVVVLHPQLNGIEQITTLFGRRKNLQKVHLVSHGSVGSLKLGASELNLDSLNDYSTQIQTWFAGFSDRISLYIYGCQVASGEKGRNFIEKLHKLTGANIAAATQIVGSSNNGGVWQLDYTTGAIDSEIAFSDELIQTYPSTFMDEETNTFQGVVTVENGVIFVDGEEVSVPEGEPLIVEGTGGEGDVVIGANVLDSNSDTDEGDNTSNLNLDETLGEPSEEESAEVPVNEPVVEEPVAETPEAETDVEVETALDESVIEALAEEDSVVEQTVAEIPEAETAVEVETANDESVIEAAVVEEPVTETPEAETAVEVETANDESVIEAAVVEEPVTETPEAETAVEVETALDESVTEPIAEEASAVEQTVAETPEVVELISQEPLAEDSIEVETVETGIDESVTEPAVAEDPVVAEIPEGEAPIELETQIEESAIEPFTEEDSAVEQAVAGISEGEALIEVGTALDESVIEPAVVEDSVVEETAGIPVVVEPAVVEDSFIEPFIVDAPIAAADDVIDLSAIAEGDTVLTEFSVAREASFNNTVDFYEVNADGSVVDPESGETITVGEAGYTEAALANRVGLELASENGETSEFSTELEGGRFYAPVLAVESSFDVLSDTDPNNDPDLYFTYSDANADGFDHVNNSALNVFEFEDQTNGGDEDFNDLIVTVSFGDTSAGEVPVIEEPVADAPVAEAPVEESEAIDEPVTDEPAIEPPVDESVAEPVDAPIDATVDEAPVEESEAIDEPVVDEPAIEPPVDESVAEPVDAPVDATVDEAPVEESEAIDEPVVDEPAIDPPVDESVAEPVDAPIDATVDEAPVEESEAIDEPVTDEPAIEPPVDESVAEPIDAPVDEAPVEESEAIDEPVVDEPAIDPPVAEFAEVPIEEFSASESLADNALNGVEIQLEQFAPNLETLITEPLTAVIGDEAEFTFGETESNEITGTEAGNSQIDIISGASGQASIVYEAGSSQPEITLDAGEFNGLVFSDLTGDLPTIENVTLDESATTIGFDSSDVSFSEDTISINFESLSIEPGSTARFDVEFADV